MYRFIDKIPPFNIPIKIVVNLGNNSKGFGGTHVFFRDGKMAYKEKNHKILWVDRHGWFHLNNTEYWEIYFSKIEINI